MRGRREQRVEGLADAGVVGQRLAHAHEDDVGQPARAAVDLAVGHGGRGGDRLADDLGSRQVARQAALPGRAEGAGHPAAGLAGDADRRPVGIAHEHALDEGAVVQPPEGLAGAAVVGGLVPDDGQQAGQQRLGEGVADAGGQVGHLRRVGDPAVEVPGQLVGAEGRLPELGDRRAGLLAGEIGEVARGHAPAGGV